MKSLICEFDVTTLSIEASEMSICVFGKYNVEDIITFANHYYPNTFSWQIKNQEPCTWEDSQRTHYTLCQPKYLVT